MSLFKRDKDNFSRTRIYRKSRKFFKLLYLFSSLLLIGIIILFLTKTSFFRIRKFSCFVNDSICSVLTYTQVASVVLGKNSLSTSESQLKLDLENIFHNSNKIEVKKNFSKVMVRLSRGVPIAAIEQKGKYALVDASGFLIEEADSSSGLFLIVISNFSKFEVKDKIIEKEILKALELSIEARNRNSELLKAEVSEGQVKLFLRDSIIVLASTEKDSLQQIDSLQLILAKSKMNKDRLSEIDLRYENPIIR